MNVSLKRKGDFSPNQRKCKKHRKESPENTTGLNLFSMGTTTRKGRKSRRNIMSKGNKDKQKE